MHMGDALISGAVGGGMAIVTASAIVYSIKKVKESGLCDKKIPLMGVMGAFVFAAQMINFAIPVTGSSGHIGGGILLAAILGAYPALIVIASVLVIQCLFFADGGLLALGCNIFNLGVITSLIIYPLIFKPIIRKGITTKRLTIAAIAASILSLQLAAFGVVLETVLSGITELPFVPFLTLMQPIHLAIGVVEGLATAAVLGFVYKMRPEILESTANDTQINVSIKTILVTLSIFAILVGGGLSMVASGYPDGLEWSMQKVAGTAELETSGIAHEISAEIQGATALLPDYEYVSISGIVGGIFTMLLAITIGMIISKSKRKNA